jgi:hypothetical protein
MVHLQEISGRKLLTPGVYKRITILKNFQQKLVMFKDTFHNTNIVWMTLLKVMYLQNIHQCKQIHPMPSPWISHACNRVLIIFLQKTQYSIDYKTHIHNSLVCSMMELVAIMINSELCMYFAYIHSMLLTITAAAQII